MVGCHDLKQQLQESSLQHSSECFRWSIDTTTYHMDLFQEIPEVTLIEKYYHSPINTTMTLFPFGLMRM